MVIFSDFQGYVLVWHSYKLKESGHVAMINNDGEMRAQNR